MAAPICLRVVAYAAAPFSPGPQLPTASASFGVKASAPPRRAAPSHLSASRRDTSPLAIPLARARRRSARSFLASSAPSFPQRGGARQPRRAEGLLLLPLRHFRLRPPILLLR